MLTRVKHMVGPLVLAIAATASGCDDGSLQLDEASSNSVPPPAAAAGATGDASSVAAPVKLPFVAPAAVGGAESPVEQAGAPAPEPASSPAAASASAESADAPAEDEPAFARPQATGSPSEGLSAEPQAWPTDCDFLDAFTAHGSAGATDRTKYRVAPGVEGIVHFVFTPPWGADSVQLLEARPILDNTRVVHHWALYAATGAASLAGAVQDDAVALILRGTLDEQFVVGGGPGAGRMKLPDGVGLRVPAGPDTLFVLQIHYYNASSDTPEQDASGVELCATRTPRAVEAAVHFLGTQTLTLPAHQRTDVRAVCDPDPFEEPVHVMAASPHMHRAGMRSQLRLERASGDAALLLDEPYTFMEQRAYPIPRDGSAADVLIQPGDRLVTTCGYDNQTDQTITYGEYTEQEMCLMMLWAWPAGLLRASTAGVLSAASDTNCINP